MNFVPVKTAALFISCLTLLLVAFTSCEKGSLENLDPAKEILAFSLKRADGTAFDTAAIKVTISGDSIYVVLPAGTDLTHLIPELVIKGKTISPQSGTMQDFSNAVVYTVTAEDGSTRKYTVKVSVAGINSLVFIGSSDNNFYALDAGTGALRWKYTGGNFSYSSPTYYDGVVYVGSIDTYVYAFDAATGSVIWRYKAGEGIESDAVYADGMVYVGGNDDNLYALDAATGKLKWKFSTGGNISASPTIAHGMVYFGSSDSKLYAVDAASGAMKWAFSTGAMINQSGPSLVNGVLYVGSRDSYLYAIDAATGTMKWKFGTGGISLEQSSPTVVNGVVYIAGWYNVPGFTAKGSVYAVNAADGRLIWEALPNSGFSSSPCVSNGRLYISSDDLHFYALDITNGHVLWRSQILPNGASAAVANGIVYIGGGGTGYIYAFDAITGELKWKFATPGGLDSSSPLVIGQTGETYYYGDSGALP